MNVAGVVNVTQALDYLGPLCPIMTLHDSTKYAVILRIKRPSATHLMYINSVFIEHLEMGQALLIQRLMRHSPCPQEVSPERNSKTMKYNNVTNHS